MANISDEIIKTIKYAVDRKTINCDRTYKTVIKRIVKKGYVVLDEDGQERTAKCCIPGVELKAGDSVLVKIPNGNLKQIHILGISGNTTPITTATKIGSSTVGNSKMPIYINKGVVTACNFSTITYSDAEPLDLNSGATWIDA